VKNPPEQFTGDAWFDVIASPQHKDQRMVVGLVRFAPGARTAWHSHANGQTLHVTHDIARMHARRRHHRSAARTDRLGSVALTVRTRGRGD
jgi:hypothetical protein